MSNIKSFEVPAPVINRHLTLEQIGAITLLVAVKAGVIEENCRLMHQAMPIAYQLRDMGVLDIKLHPKKELIIRLLFDGLERLSGPYSQCTPPPPPHLS